MEKNQNILDKIISMSTIARIDNSAKCKYKKTHFIVTLPVSKEEFFVFFYCCLEIRIHNIDMSMC